MKNFEAVENNFNKEENYSDYPRSCNLWEKRIFPLHTNFDLRAFIKCIEECWRYLWKQNYKVIVGNDLQRRCSVISQDITLKDMGRLNIHNDRGGVFFVPSALKTR